MFHYLATPYSKFEGGDLDAACRMACTIAARLIQAGVPVFSPIAHSHAVAKLGGIDPLDWKLWLAAAEPLMRASCGLLIFKAPGWRRSKGIAEEIRIFRRMRKPVRAISPVSVRDAGVHAVLRYAAEAKPFTLAEACAEHGLKFADVLAERAAERIAFEAINGSQFPAPAGAIKTDQPRTESAEGALSPSAGASRSPDAGNLSAGAASFTREEIEAAATQAACAECGKSRAYCLCPPVFLRRPKEQQQPDVVGK